MEGTLKTTLTVPELMEDMSISRTYAYGLIHQKGFPAFRIGKKILIDRAGLEKWKEEKIRAGI